ncbi:MAG: hypothetical protein ABW116_15415 [Candidatus Sedimenticola sp. 20ELBAFRAG]
MFKKRDNGPEANANLDVPKGKITQPTKEMLDNPYHPDWKSHSGTEYRGVGASQVTEDTKLYRYVGEGEAKAIRNSGEIPNVDRAGNPKDVYITNRQYETAGRAKTHNQLPSKPVYRVEIDPADVPNRTPFTKVNPGDNPQWGVGGGVEATTKDAIPVDPSTLTRLKGSK